MYLLQFLLDLVQWKVWPAARFRRIPGRRRLIEPFAARRVKMGHDRARPAGTAAFVVHRLSRVARPLHRKPDLPLERTTIV
ncbi:hypothetical protein ISG12_18105 [Burkholderia pseudomallei]|nr:hypothetical protein [Burkholderia pseudomallei]ALB09669.1 hypothetical protein ACT79_00645 [Burkholderia pseudomallei]MBF3903739.1 hypothetical protein [Burkholderia pseudomallei]MBM5622560.1 hypothetical protein [Burkholderia pseudomallei]